MINENDLQEAIAECQGVRNPNANTCLRLASYYTILDHTKPKSEPTVQTYSYAKGDTVDFSFSDTEFARLVDGKPSNSMWRLMDELMTTLQIVNPRLYTGVIRKIADE